MTSRQVLPGTALARRNRPTTGASDRRDTSVEFPRSATSGAAGARARTDHCVDRQRGKSAASAGERRERARAPPPHRAAGHLGVGRPQSIVPMNDLVLRAASFADFANGPSQDVAAPRAEDVRRLEVAGARRGRGKDIGESTNGRDPRVKREESRQVARPSRTGLRRSGRTKRTLQGRPVVVDAHRGDTAAAACRRLTRELPQARRDRDIGVEIDRGKPRAWNRRGWRAAVFDALPVSNTRTSSRSRVAIGGPFVIASVGHDATSSSPAKRSGKRESSVSPSLPLRLCAV